MMQASKKVPFEDPMVLNGVRAMYILSNVIIAAIYLYIQSQVNKKKGKPLTSLEYHDTICLPSMTTGKPIAFNRS